MDVCVEQLRTAGLLTAGRLFAQNLGLVEENVRGADLCGLCALSHVD